MKREEESKHGSQRGKLNWKREEKIYPKTASEKLSESERIVLATTKNSIKAIKCQIHIVTGKRKRPTIPQINYWIFSSLF